MLSLMGVQLIFMQKEEVVMQPLKYLMLCIMSTDMQLILEDTILEVGMENGAMNEGFADIWALSLTNSPILGARLGFS